MHVRRQAHVQACMRKKIRIMHCHLKFESGKQMPWRAQMTAQVQAESSGGLGSGSTGLKLRPREGGTGCWATS